MATQAPPATAIHHLRLTVSDISRARAFYTEVLGFQVAMELPPGVLLSNGHTLVGLRPTADSARSEG